MCPFAKPAARTPRLVWCDGWPRRSTCPPAEHNALLTATGFAPVFPEHPLSHEALAGVQFVVQRLLAAYAPYPALVLNARYDIVDLNAGARSLLRALGIGPSPHGHEADGAAASPGGPLNLVELLHTQLRPLIVNDLEVRTDMRQRLRRDLVERPGDARLTALLSQLHMPTRPPRRRGCPRCCSHASGSPAGVCRRSRPSCTSAAPVT